MVPGVVWGGSGWFRQVPAGSGWVPRFNTPIEAGSNGAMPRYSRTDKISMVRLTINDFGHS